MEYLEVVSTENISEKQKILKIQFLKDLSNPILPEHIFITRDDTLSGIKVSEVIDSTPNSITIKLSNHGDFSLYTLHLMEDLEEKEFLPGFDRMLSFIQFSFKVECFTDIDCKAEENSCAEASTEDTLNINYLVKDYASFRQLILDRMSLLVPGWTERNPADLGMTLVELLAYVGDYLSYRQDAITTEAYLSTARKRISVRRHARLVDYHMHEGVNARTWVHIDVSEDSDEQWIRKVDANDFRTKFLPHNQIKNNDELVLNENQFLKILDQNPLVFEPLHDLQLFHVHNSISFHNYGNVDCCLPKGSTQATLVGQLDKLKINDVLIFKEILGPKTGSVSDADPDHRHAVKIIDIEFSTDFDFSEDPATELDITLIRWSEEDALPFPLCISSTISNEEKQEILEVSIALGNNVLADHGLSVSDLKEIDPNFENIQGSLFPARVPDSKYHYAYQHANHCSEDFRRPIPPRYNPMIEAYPITHSQRLEFNNSDASDLLISATKSISQDPAKAVPCVELTEIMDSETGYQILPDKWTTVNDLLIDSSILDQHFVIENDDNSRSFIRFGNNINGKFPASGSKFLAEYRIGNGTTGNLGRDSLGLIVTTNLSLKIDSISNPLAAIGGKEPESVEEVKQYAPQAFRTQERAVTVKDYEDMAKRCKKDIQSVNANLRWTGSWHTAYITADRLGGKKVSEQWENELKGCLQTYRLTGLDLEVDEPVYVGLELELSVCLLPNSFKVDVLREIKNWLSNKSRNGIMGFFHPDNLVFGQTLYLSKIYAIVQHIPGVQSVEINKFQRYGLPGSSGLETGKLEFGKREIPRLDNDPNRIDMGFLTIKVKGGR